MGEALKLTGWVRAWIVSAVIVWAAGGWWFVANAPEEPRLISPRGECFGAYGMEPGIWGGCEYGEQACAEMLRQCYADISEEREAEFYAYAREEQQRHQVEYWTTLGAVIAAPFILGLAAMIVFAVGKWVRRGFA